MSADFWLGVAAAMIFALIAGSVLFRWTTRKAAAKLDRFEVFRAVADNLPDFFFVKDVEDQFRYIASNRPHEEVIGLRSDEIIGKTDSDLFAGEALEKILAEDRRLLAGEVLNTCDDFVNFAGKRMVVRTVKKIVTRQDGTRLMVGMGSDISRQHQLELDQRRAIEELNAYVANERIVNQLLTRITLEENSDLAVQEMLRLIGENIGADRCCLFQFTDDSRQRSRCVFEWESADTAPLKDTKMFQDIDMTGFGSWQKTLLERRPLVISDLDNPPADLAYPCALLRRLGVRSMLICGIWVADRLYGFLGVDFYRFRKAFSDREASMLDSLAGLFTLAFERARQREKLLESVSLQRQIMDNILLPVTIIDFDYRVLAANPSAEEDAGKPLDQLLGTHCYDTICGVGEPPDFCPVRDTLLTGKSCSKEHEFKGKQQISTAQPIFDLNGEMQYILTVDVDITELTRQKRDLTAAMERAQAADRAKSSFLATVSHELRTPLNAVIGFSELLLLDNVDQVVREEYLNAIRFSGTALLNLINDVLDLSKLEADQMEIIPAENDVTELIHQVLSVFKLKAAEKQLELREDTAGVRYPLFVDNLRLRQILFNLLGNAVKFTQKGHVAIKASFEPDDEATGTLLISVADTGIGISPEQIQGIFDPFVRDHGTRGKQMIEGSGLGLSITKRLLDRMGGTIKLESEPGKGTTFLVRLNAIRYVNNVESAVQSLPETASPPPNTLGSGKRALLVDDVQLNLRVLAAMLAHRGVTSVTANSVAEAVEVLKNDRAFDAVLTDMWMPEENGDVLSKHIRQDPELAHIPVWAVTADTLVPPEVMEGFSGILSKPLSTDMLDRVFQTAGE